MRTLKAILVGLIFCASLQAQSVVISSRIRSGASLPATCTVGDIYFQTATVIGPEYCIATNTWNALGNNAVFPNGVTITTGTLTMGTSQAINSTTSRLEQIGGATIGTWLAQGLSFGTNATVGSNASGNPTAQFNIQGKPINFSNDTGSVTFSIGASTKPAWGTTGAQLYVPPLTWTDSSGSGTISVTAFDSFGVPTLVNSNTSTTYTTAATVYIAGSPVASTNTTITNGYAIYVAAGNIRTQGNFELPQNSSLLLNGPSDSASRVYRDTSGNTNLNSGTNLILTNATGLKLTQSTPADNATCTAGTLFVDATAIYACTASGTVKKVTLSAF